MLKIKHAVTQHRQIQIRIKYGNTRQTSGLF